MVRRGVLAFVVVGAAAISAPVPALVGATEGFVSVGTPYEVTAGQRVPIRAHLVEWVDRNHLRRCSLTVRGPGRASLRAPAKRVRGSARVGWKVKLPLLAPPGSWRVRLACAGLGTASDTFSVEPAIAAARTWGAQVVRLSDYESYYAWAVRLRNPFRDRELRSVDVQARLIDAAGRVVGTAEFSDAATLPAGHSAWIGYRSTVEGEVPVRVAVRARGEVHRRRARALGTRDLRLVRIPPRFEWESPELSVRGEVLNTNRYTVTSDYVFVSVFDGAGRLVNAAYDSYPGIVSAGGSAPLDLDLGADGFDTAARVEVFWPPDPR